MDRPFGAARSVSQAFDSTSSSVYLGTYGARANEIRITSGAGNDVCFLAMGGSDVAAAVTDFPVLPGTIEVLTKPPGVTHIALIAAGADTGTVYITGGEGAGPAVFFISGSASVTGTQDVALTPVAYTGTAGVTPYTFSATGLPDGLVLNITGTLYGTPTEEITEDVVIRAVDAMGNVATLTVEIAIAGAPAGSNVVYGSDAVTYVGDNVTYG